MESLGLLAMLGLVLLMGAIAASMRKRGDTRGRRPPRPRPTPVSDRQRPAPSPWRTPTRAPFDGESARRPRKVGLIEGRAWVVDGDTLVIDRVQIRLFGVDAPEMDHPFGRKAKWALVSLCKGRRIRAEVTDEDAYGRTVAKCFLDDGRDLSAEMVKLGMAIDWPKFSGGVYRKLETPDARRKLWLADARQKGRMHVWEAFEARRSSGDRR